MRVVEILHRFINRDGDDSPEKVRRLLKSKPKKVVWITKPKQRWVIAYNPKTMHATTSDVFSSELAVYNYPIGVGEMTVPKKFLAADVFARLFYSLEWPGADVRPEKKYRNLRRPGVIEVIY